MGTFGKFVLLALLAGAIGLFCVGGCILSIYNHGVSLQQSMTAQEKSNQNALSAVIQTLNEKAGVTLQGAEEQHKFVAALAKGREGGSLLKMIQEANPNFDVSLFADLSRAIEAQFTIFKTAQDRLISIQNEFRILKNKLPHKFIVGSLVEPAVTIVLTGDTQDAYKTGTAPTLDLMGKNGSKTSGG